MSVAILDQEPLNLCETPLILGENPLSIRPAHASDLSEDRTKALCTRAAPNLLIGAALSLISLERMTCRVSHTTIDCRDAFALSEWWRQVLGYADVPGDPNEPGDEECMILDPGTGHRLLFVEVPDDKVAKNRIHLDLVPTDRLRDEEVERSIGLGAQVLADLRSDDGTGWVVLADPEGNEFCILRSDRERAAAES